MLRACLALLAIVTTTACGGHGADGPARSPTLDYPLPAAQTSDGEVVGADRVPPGDKLEEGVHAGSHGVIPGGKPGGAAPEQANPENKPRPCSEIGLEDASGQSRCKKPPAKP